MCTREGKLVNNRTVLKLLKRCQLLFTFFFYLFFFVFT